MAEQRPLYGRKLGGRRVVVDPPHARYFRYLGPGVLEAKLEAQAPRTAYQRRTATLSSTWGSTRRPASCSSHGGLAKPTLLV